MKDNISTLKDELIAYYKPYYDKNDNVHDIRHLVEVMDMALKLREFVMEQDNAEVSIGLLMLAVCIHDIYSGFNRKEHHNLAYEYALHDAGDIYLNKLSTEDRSIIAHAVKEHRSSSGTHAYHSIISEILASADRGNIDITSLLERMSRNDTTDDAIRKHLHDKFSSVGYNKLPSLYIRYYGEEYIVRCKQSVDDYIKLDTKVCNKYDIVMMDTANIWSKMSSCTRRQVGAVIAKDDRIIAIGYNGTVKGSHNDCESVCTTCSGKGCTSCNGKGIVTNNTTVHAEVNAIAYCARIGMSTANTTLYVTTEPCIDCAKLILSSGITRVVYRDKYKSDVGVQFLKTAGLNVEMIRTDNVI